MQITVNSGEKFELNCTASEYEQAVKLNDVLWGVWLGKMIDGASFERAMESARVYHEMLTNDLSAYHEMLVDAANRGRS
jgi:hypothetical protein